LPGHHGLTWPWESFHIEALAWFDQWLKGRDTGVLDGPRVRYTITEADDVWRESEAWPPRANYQFFSLRSDAVLSESADSGARAYMNLGTGLGREQTSEADPPSLLEWNTAPLVADLDVVGPIELVLDVTSTAPDTAFIAVLQDVDPAGATIDITAGYLRAALRVVDESSSRLGAPVLPCTRFDAVPVGVATRYRIPLVPNAHRFRSGHRIRLCLTSDDQDSKKPAPLAFRHASIGTSAIHEVASTSRLYLPVLPANASS